MRNKNKKILLTDFESCDNWSFLSTLKNENSSDWIEWSMPTNYLHGNFFKNIIRYTIYLFYPLVVLFRRQKVEDIIAWQQFYGLNFAFWLRLFSLKKKQRLIIMTFIYKPKKGLVGKVYRKYMTFIVNSIYIDKFVCFSKKECNFYSDLFHTSRKRFQYIPLGIESLNKEILINNSVRPFIFSTGRSNRDYDFLISSLKDEDYEIHIACDAIRNIHNNDKIIIDNNCFGDAMLKEMAKCKCVVIVLRDKNISSGQLVILQAMQLGKPVVVTRSSGTEEYIEDGVNGILIDNNKDELLAALNRLYTDKLFYSELSMNSIKIFKKQYTIECLAKNIIKIINEIDN